MKKRGLLRKDVKHRRVKFLNNGIESDHAPIKKKLIVATGGFKIQKRAWSAIQGFESLRMLNKGQLLIFGYAMMNVKLLCGRDPPS